MKEKKIRARPLGQSVVQTEQDLKPEFRLKVAEWEVRKAMIGATKPEPKRVEDTEIDKIKKLMPDDFNRKLKEWERLKLDQAGSGNSRQHRDPSPPNDSLDHAREVIRRKSSSSSTSIDVTNKQGIIRSGGGGRSGH